MLRETSKKSFTSEYSPADFPEFLLSSLSSFVSLLVLWNIHQPKIPTNNAPPKLEEESSQIYDLTFNIYWKIIFNELQEQLPVAWLEMDFQHNKNYNF